MSLQLRVYVPDHPLVKHWLGVARDAGTPPTLFRSAIAELGRWLTYEAMRHDWLPVTETQVQTPLQAAPATLIDYSVPVAVVPILRAGLALLDGGQGLLPLATTYHLGLSRDEETLQPSCYLNNLPDRLDPATRVLIFEPMLATGGSILLAIDELTKRGADPALTRVISVVAAPVALQKLGAQHPSLTVYVATIDEGLDDRGYIVPGLGDAGDRAFAT